MINVEIDVRMQQRFVNHFFQDTKQYTYDEKSCPQRVKDIRSVIVEIDKQIEEVLKMKLLTLEDYQKAGEEFWPKYWYVAKELGKMLGQRMFSKLWKQWVVLH